MLSEPSRSPQAQGCLLAGWLFWARCLRKSCLRIRERTTPLSARFMCKPNTRTGVHHATVRWDPPHPSTMQCKVRARRRCYLPDGFTYLASRQLPQPCPRAGASRSRNAAAAIGGHEMSGSCWKSWTNRQASSKALSSLRLSIIAPQPCIPFQGLVAFNPPISILEWPSVSAVRGES
jgi:hypothetical protein